MPLIVPKEILLNSFMNVAKKDLMDKDYLITKLQLLVVDNRLTQEDVQPIVDVLIGGEEVDGTDKENGLTP